MAAFQNKSAWRTSQTPLAHMTALLRLPSVGAVVHMTAERDRLFRLRTFQPSLSAPDGRYSLRPASSILPLPIDCPALQASWREQTPAAKASLVSLMKPQVEYSLFPSCLFLSASTQVQSTVFKCQSIGGECIVMMSQFLKQNQCSHTHASTFNTA